MRATKEVRESANHLLKWLNYEVGIDADVDSLVKFSEESRERIAILLRTVQAQTSVEIEVSSDRARLWVDFPHIERLLRPYQIGVTLGFMPDRSCWSSLRRPITGIQCPPHEHLAAFAVLDLVKASCLGKIKRCECSAWFFARGRNVVACTEACRKANWDRKPENKLRRREQRLNNADYKTGKVHLRGAASAKAAR